MAEHLEDLHTIEELENALSQSNEQAVLLFKHSLSCPISARALGELQSYLEHADPRVTYKLITVQTARNVSDQASSKLGITHESPQAILVRGGQQVWNASHSEITASELDRAIRNVT